MKGEKMVFEHEINRFEKDRILQWDNPDPKEQMIAVRSAKRLAHLGNFWSRNLPIQFVRDFEDGPDQLLRICNYMAGQSQCHDMSAFELFGSNNYTAQDIKDVCDTSIAILKNLIKQIEEFRDGERHSVVFPNDRD